MGRIQTKPEVMSDDIPSRSGPLSRGERGPAITNKAPFGYSDLATIWHSSARRQL